MVRISVTSLIVLMAALGAHWMLAPDEAAGAAPDLDIAIVPTRDGWGRLTIPHHEHFNVHLTNRTGKSIKLWHQFCEPGHDTLNFRITDKGGNSWTMRKANLGRYWEEYPLKTISIAAGATYVWRVVPTEIQVTRSWTGMLEPNSGEDVTIAPLFETKGDAQTKQHGIWTGRVEGKAVKVRVVNPKLTTPHDYLWSDCPKQALRVMQADPKWINKKDPEYQCTPLHHASRFGFVEVVEWLLANGAEVDARAYNDFSPLYFADEPDIVRALLRHRPMDKKRAVAFFRRPLENAAEQVAWGGTDAKKWREIAKLMLDSGAPYSLQVAIYLNDVARVKDVLKENSRLANALEGSERTPLRVAARIGRTEICKILLKHKADPNDWENGVGFPILVAAITHPAVVKLLLDGGADIKKRISWTGGGKEGFWIIDDEATALHFAAEAGTGSLGGVTGFPVFTEPGALESARLLLDAGIDVGAKDTKGQTALDVAARLGQGDIAYLIANRMGTAEARDKGWRTLLRQLLLRGESDKLRQALKEKDVAAILAREGPAFMSFAAFNVQTAETKQQYRANARSLAIIATLHEHGIPIDMYAAIASDNLVRVKQLLKADPALAKGKDHEKKPLLHRATALDRREIVVVMLKAGADVEASDAGGYTALHGAAFWGRPEIAALLLERRADVNARTRNGLTPLHEAARLQSVAVARRLLAAGANVRATDNDGKTPLDLARGGEEAEMIDLLRRYEADK